MIFVYPHNEDWNAIAELTQDRSWSAENMRRYFERMEDCRHRAPYRWAEKIFGFNPTRHGFGGWLTTERADPSLALGDRDMMAVIARSAMKAFERLGEPLTQLDWSAESQHDPNDWRLVQENAFGLRYAPLTTRDHTRIGSRERILEVAEKFPDRLRIELYALATRVLFDDENRAIGIEYLKGERLYRAHANPGSGGAEKRQVEDPASLNILCPLFELCPCHTAGGEQEASHSGKREAAHEGRFKAKLQSTPPCCPRCAQNLPLSR